MPLRISGHSHSIVLGHGNALNFQRNFFQHTTKNRLADPSQISALEFKGEFRRFKIRSVSPTIGINRSILSKSAARAAVLLAPKKTVSRSNESPTCEFATTEVHHLRISGHADRTTGNRANAPVVVWAKVFEANCRAARSASMMAVRDRIQRDRHVVQLVVQLIKDLSPDLDSIETRDAAFPLPHDPGD